MRFCLSAVALLSAFAAFPSAGAVLDFNELTYAGPNPFTAVNPIVTGDYRIVSEFNADPDNLAVWRNDSVFQADPGFAAVLNRGNGADVRIRRLDGLPFLLNSIDLASASNGNGGFVAVQFSFYGSTFSRETVTTDTLPGLQRFSFSPRVVSSVGWETVFGEGSHQFDNIVVSVVPEQSAYALMLSGFGLIVYAVRRRNRA